MGSQAIKRRRVLVTGVSHDAGVSVVQQLAGSGFEVVGADHWRLPLGLHSRHLSTVHRLPSPRQEGFEQGLLDLVRALQPDAVVPLFNDGVQSCLRHESLLRRLTGLLIPSGAAFGATWDKSICHSQCTALGIPCPTRYSAEEAAALLGAAAGEVTLVVKPGTDVGMARGVDYVRTVEALEGSLLTCTSRFGSPVIEEFIPGDATHMHTALLLFDRESRLLAAFTARKLRQWPDSGGVTALSASTEALHLVELALPFFRRWRWQGMAEVEIKYDARDGLYKVIEINPRCPGYLRFPLECGLPLARLWAMLALGEKMDPLPYPSYRLARKYLDPGLFMRSVVTEVVGSSAPTQALRHAVSELIDSAPTLAGRMRDPLPWLGTGLFDLNNLAVRSAHGLWSWFTQEAQGGSVTCRAAVSSSAIGVSSKAMS